MKMASQFTKNLESVEASLIIPLDPTRYKEQLKHLSNAEIELSKAGVIFDVGSDIHAGKPISREWELDWSLKGAKLIQYKGDNDNRK